MQTSFPAPREAADRKAEFSAQLVALKDDFLFAGRHLLCSSNAAVQHLCQCRYKIEPQRIQGKPHCRYAVEKFTGQSVFLKFFPRGSPELENAVRMQSTMAAGYRFVCRMLDVVANIHGFPPCLVLERGLYRLSDRMAEQQMSSMDQRAILYSVLEALEYLHSRGIVHGNLTPFHIMWFASECTWKLVDIENASHEGEVTVQHQVGRYASPEHIQADKRGKVAFALDSAADMWSFGVIAFEILTRSSVVDAVALQEYIDAALGSPDVAADRLPQRWLSANRRGRVELATDEQNLRFVQKLLRHTPDDRRKATDALEDALLRSATDVYQRMDNQGEEIVDTTETRNVAEMREWAWIVTLNNHLPLSVEVEYLPEDGTQTLAFHERTGELAWAFDDDYLADHPVYYLKLRKTYRLHIRLIPDIGYDIAVQRIVSVAAKPSDGDSVALPVEQRRRDDGIVALALFEPELLGSQRLQTVSPRVGPVDEKYVRVEIHIRIAVGGPLAREIDYYQNIYCKVIKRKSKLRFHRLLGMVNNKGVIRPPFELD